jgi:hypothetical protein
MGFLISFFTLPRKIALRVFKPDERNMWVAEDATMAKLGYARSLLGVLIVLAVALRYQGLHGSEFNLGQRVAGLIITAVVVGVNSLVIAAALILAIRGRARLSTARHLQVPARTFLAYLGICFLVYLLIEVWDKFDANPIIGTLLTLAIAPLLLVLWSVILVCLSSFYCATYLCRAAEGHPLLPPVLAATAAWTTAMVGPFILGSAAAGPVGLFGFVLLIGGPTAITVLSAVEIWRLRYVPGLDLRGGPPTAPLERDAVALPATFAGAFPLGVTLAAAAAVIAAITVLTLHITRLHAL